MDPRSSQRRREHREVEAFSEATSHRMDPWVLESSNGEDAAPAGSREELEESVIGTLRTVYDPEIPLNIYDLGLIYHLSADESGAVDVTLTLTSPGCPVAGELVREVHTRLLGLPGVTRVRTELVWDPPWTRERLSPAALLELGLL